VGISWYWCLKNVNTEYLKRSMYKIEDHNMIKWCNYIHFSIMYIGVYLSMVKTGVDIDTTKARMYNNNVDCLMRA
jgi:hypothetical protein